jgi:serine/threonine-protein kinase
MELLDGFDLQTLVERFGPIPTGRAARLLVQVCHSLAEAHEEGLVHRDIKPPNVFVCRYGRDLDFVKVLDFGLVKPLPTYEQDSGLTAAHSVRGTPAFMPPEQALGLYPIDGRTDIYAVGCLGYWLVTGETVFTGRTAMETLTKHTQEAPTPPSRRATLPVPEDFDRLILGCLEKDPARRPSNALTLARQLAPLATANGWSDEHAERWWTEHGPQTRRPPAADHLATPVGMR